MTDPCVAATINDPTLTAITVQDGATVTETFTEATDSVDASNTVAGYCGDRNYRVVDANTGTPNAVTWISVSKDTPSIDTHTITASPADTSLGGNSYSYYLEITYANYAAHAPQYTALSVQVTAANCNCELLTWDDPTRTDVTINVGDSSSTLNVPAATANTASKTASQDIETCYLSSGCAETFTNALLMDDGTAVTAAGGGFITVNAA